MSRRPPPNERRSLLLGGPDSWRRVVLYGILAGVVLAVVAAVVAALIAGRERDPLDPQQTPTAPAARWEVLPAWRYSSTISPLLPPDFRASRTDSIRISRSTALHIS